MKKQFLIILSIFLLVFFTASCGTSETKLTVDLSKADTKGTSKGELKASSTAAVAMTEKISIENTSEQTPTSPINIEGITIPTETILVSPSTTVEQAPSVKPGTGGEFVFGYVSKMALPRIVPSGRYDEYVEWDQKVWADLSLNKGRASIYDFIRDFNISEDYFREESEKMLEPFTEVEINDLYNLTKAEFNQKYANNYMIVKGEIIYDIRDLMKIKAGVSVDEVVSKAVQLDDTTRAKILEQADTVTKDEIVALLDKEYESDPEMVEYYREKYGY